MLDRSLNPYYLNDFLSYNETILNKSPNTVKEYSYDLINFLKFIKMHNNLTGEKDFEKIKIIDVSESILRHISLSDLYSYMSFLTNTSKNKPATRARKVASIKAFFKFLHKKANILDSDPAQDLETPKLDKRIPKYLTLDESINLLNTVGNDEKRNNERNYAIITLFLNCGMRLSELVGINITDIKEDKLTVIGKGNKERTVYLNKACLNAINEYLKVRPREGVIDKNALFLSERKERISNRMVQHIVKTDLKKAGLDVDKYSTHKLRHTAATLMYKYGNVDIRALQEILGHESIATTEIYTHVDNSQIKAAVDRNPLANI